MRGKGSIGSGETIVKDFLKKTIGEIAAYLYANVNELLERGII